MNIQKTKNYGQFSTFDWNRKIDYKHVHRIVNSMKQYGWMGSPVYVDKNYKIWDGQHRIKAASIVGIPVEYCVTNDYTPEIVIVSNSTSRSWGLADYVSFYSKQGNENYKRLVELCNSFPAIEIRGILRSMNKFTSTDNIKSGSVEITEEDSIKAEKKLKEISKLLSLFPKGSQKVKFSACAFLVENYPKIVLEKISDSVRKTGGNMNFVDGQSFMDNLETIYNRRKTEENRIYFSEDYKRSTHAKQTLIRRQKHNGQYQSQRKLFE